MIEHLLFTYCPYHQNIFDSFGKSLEGLADLDIPVTPVVMGHVDTQALRQIKLLQSSSWPYYSLPPHNFLSRLLHSLLPLSLPLRIFSLPPRKCWVTKGSISSQQSGLKFHKNPDAYFIVLWSPYIMLYPPGCLSTFISSSCGDLFFIFVHL